MSLASEACRAMAPIMSGDEGANYCSKAKGHDGPHWCMPIEVPYPYDALPGYGRSWPNEAASSEKEPS